jgi:hypothetical protein
MIFTNKHNLPDSFVQAVTNDPYYDEERGDISVTTLIGPAQARVLKDKFSDKIVEDVADRLWALFGQMGHALLERQTVKSAIKEKRLFSEFGGWSLSGKFDNLTLLPELILQDYKFTATYAVKEVKPEWEAQLNILNLLAKINGYPEIKRLQVIAMLRDWFPSMLEKSPDKYPACQVKVMDVKMWSEDETVKYIEDRIKIHQEADKGNIPECTDEERWASNLCYKVIKQGNKNASKGGVFTSEFSGDPKHEAEQFIKNHKDGALMTAFKQPREFKRCEKYCSVSPFCKQFQGV